MVARMNFGAQLASNQRFNLVEAARPHRSTPESVLGYFLQRMPTADLDGAVRGELLNYLRAGASWSGSDAQLNTRVPGLVHLISSMSEYQLN
jgi:hypothetical protein